MARVLSKRNVPIDLINEQHDNKTARTLTEFRSEAPKNSSCRVQNVDFKNAQYDVKFARFPWRYVRINL